jgi:ribose 5-phosphate isomerase B
MRIVLAGDHAGYSYKNEILSFLIEKGFYIDDLGCYSDESCDYPDFVHPAAQKVNDGMYDFGVLFCGSANGVAITANKHPKVRAAISWNKEVAELARLHNDANVLCIPCRFVSLEQAKEIIDTFLHTDFEGGRHERRVQKIQI